MSILGGNIIDRVTSALYSHQFLVLLGDKEFKQFESKYAGVSKIDRVQIAHISKPSYYKFLVSKDE